MPHVYMAYVPVNVPHLKKQIILSVCAVQSSLGVTVVLCGISAGSPHLIAGGVGLRKGKGDGGGVCVWERGV